MIQYFVSPVFSEFLDGLAFLSMLLALVYLSRKKVSFKSGRSIGIVAAFLVVGCLVHWFDVWYALPVSAPEDQVSGLFMTVFSMVAIFAPWFLVPLILDAQKQQAAKDAVLQEQVRDSASELRSALAQQQDAEDRFQLAIEVAPQGMLLVDETGTIVVANKEIERIFGYPRADIIGRSVEILMPESFRVNHVLQRKEYHQQPRDRLMGAGRELNAQRKDGRTFPVEIGLSSIHTDKKMLVMVTIVDITLRKQQERELRERAEELERINADLDQFAYVASHDLKAPLRAIDSLARWIVEDLGADLPTETKNNISLLKGRIRRMELLLESLLEYYRVGRTRYRASDVDTGELLREVVEVLDLPEQFRVNIAADMPMLRTPRPPLELVFRNLLANSIKHHHRRDGVIDISAVDIGSAIRFCIADDGPGIPAASHEKVFEMFQTLRPRDEVEGSGMGLTLVRKTVLTHGGKIELRSSEGNGAQFCIEWPKQVEQALEAGA